MAKVHEIAGGLLVSISTLAREFGMGRDTVSKRLEQCGVKSADEVKGYPVYRIAEASKAILGSSGTSSGGDKQDPELMQPFERNAWYKGESERLKVAVEKSNLVPIEQVEAQLAAVIKRTVQMLATLPDRLERNCGLASSVVERIVMECDAIRADYHAGLLDDE